jgi:hypothetical protein
MRSGVDRRGSIVHNPAPKRPDVDQTPEEAPMPTPAPLAPQIEQFIHDNPQRVRLKFKNLLRDPRCSVLISHAAQLTHSGNTEPEALRLARRHHHPPAEPGLGRVRPHRGGRQTGGDAAAARPRLRHRAGQDA